MDDPALALHVYDQVLADLARVNAWTLASRPTFSFLARASAGMRSFRLLDVGFGQGDMLRRIAAWARRAGVEAELIGVDLNERSVEAAAAATPDHLPIDYRAGDYADVEGKLDFVISSLVAHHMNDCQLHDFLRFMERKAERGWLVNDLHRHVFAHKAYPLLAHLLRLHPIVRQDGQLSIARAFRRGEWAQILAQAGIDDRRARIVRFFPFRLCVERLH